MGAHFRKITTGRYGTVRAVSQKSSSRLPSTPFRSPPPQVRLRSPLSPYRSLASRQDPRRRHDLEEVNQLYETITGGLTKGRGFSARIGNGHRVLARMRLPWPRGAAPARADATHPESGPRKAGCEGHAGARRELRRVTRGIRRGRREDLIARSKRYQHLEGRLANASVVTEVSPRNVCPRRCRKDRTTGSRRTQPKRSSSGRY